MTPTVLSTSATCLSDVSVHTVDREVPARADETHLTPRFNGHTHPQRFLITGGAGFIGSHVCDALIARGDRVTVLDDLSTGRLENVSQLVDAPAFSFVEGTVMDEDVVDGLVQDADVVLHLASAVGVQLVVANPLGCLRTNVQGTDNVLTAVARHGRRAVYTSTSEVYGKNSQGALAEGADRVLGSPFKSRWAYAIAKSFGESLASGLHRESGAQIATVRLFNTVGARQTGLYGMVLPRFVRQALAGDDLTVFGNGTQTRCFVHVHDAVAGLLMIVDSEAAVGAVLNIGCSTEVPIIELARRVIMRAESASRIELVSYDLAYDEGFEELGRRWPDTTAIEAAVGWKTTRTVDDAIADVILHERARAVPSQGAPFAA